MADLELLKQLRAAGVKAVDFHYDGQSKTTNIIAVEFFPRSLLDVTEFTAGEGADPMEAATERPPPAGDKDSPPNIPPAMARILSRGSVS
jgi:hypothetical protein